jgi:hypothetical protein
VQELELAVGRDDVEPVGLGGAAGQLGEHLRARHPDAERQAGLLAHLAAQALGHAGAGSSTSLTSRNASSIEPGSTTLVQRSKMANTVRLASANASHPGSASTSDGHRRRAFAVGMPLRTPNARAS